MLYAVAASLGGETKKRVPYEAVRPVGTGKVGALWEPFSVGAVLSTNPGERTVRWVLARITALGEFPPEDAEARFDAEGNMTLIEVHARPGKSGAVAPLDVPADEIVVLVEIRHGADRVGSTAVRTTWFTERSVQLLHAWIGGQHHWSQKYKYALWRPVATTVEFDVRSGRPTKVVTQTMPSTTSAAQLAKSQYLALKA